MTCPQCGAALDPKRSEFLATGDYTAVFECGTQTDDNGDVYTSFKCDRRAADNLMKTLKGTS